MTNNTTTTSRSNPAIKTILAATFPEYRGRKIRIKAATEYQMGDYWDGGSRRYVHAYHLATGHQHVVHRAPVARPHQLQHGIGAARHELRTPAIVYGYLVLIMVFKPSGLLGEQTRVAG